MPEKENFTLDCAIVGGGISGLTAAHTLQAIAPNWKIRLFERCERLGGVLETARDQGFLIELSADNFITEPPAALQLCEQLGLGEDILPTNSMFRGADVLFRGRLTPVPVGFQVLGPQRLMAILRSPLLSIRGKLRLCCEPFIAPRKDSTDESLAAFAIRRLGKEAYERLVAPLVGGIYTADAHKLSMAAALPHFAQMEREFGSLYRGLRARAKAKNGSSTESGARYSLFATPRGGMEQLLEKLEESVPPATWQTRAEITDLARTDDGGWQLQVNGERLWTAGKLIIAIPAFHAGNLLEPHDAILGAELRGIPYASCAVVCLGYEKKQFPHPPQVFGFVVPPCEKRQILAASFSSNKYPFRAPDEQLLIRVFLGGACQESILQHGDAQLAEIAIRELKQIMGTQGEPHYQRVVRWTKAMPQYHLGHLERVAKIEKHAARLSNLALIGNAYRGVGLPHCVQGAISAVERLCGREES